MLSTKWNLIGIAFLGIGLIVLECLYPPVWEERGCLLDLTFVFIGRFAAWKSAAGQLPEIAWNVLLCHLATLGITALTAIIEARAGGCLENTKRDWFGVLVSLFLIFIFFLVPDLVPYALVLSALIFLGMLHRLGALFVAAREGDPGAISVVNRGIGQQKGWGSWYVAHLMEVFRRLSVPMRLIVVLGALGMVSTLVLNSHALISRIHRQEADAELDVALLYAVKRGDIDSTNLLLNQGASSNANGLEDVKGEIFDAGRCEVSNRGTVLGIAVAKGDLPLVKLLLAHEADVNHLHWDFFPVKSPSGGEDFAGKRPLTLAVEGGYKEIVLYLLAHGADIDARNSDGSRVIDAAIAKPELLHLLLDRSLGQK